MPGLRAVLFDLDDTLISSFHAWHGLLNDALAHFGAVPVAVERFRESWGQSVAADCEQWLPAVAPQELAAYYDHNFARHLASIELVPGARAVIEAARARQLKTACVTNSAGLIARTILADKGLLELLDVTLGADQVARAKPAPDLLLEALRQLGIAPSEAMLVGDSQYDVEAARAAGVAVIVVGPAAAGDKNIESIAEVVGWFDAEPQFPASC